MDTNIFTKKSEVYSNVGQNFLLFITLLVRLIRKNKSAVSTRTNINV